VAAKQAAPATTDTTALEAAIAQTTQIQAGVNIANTELNSTKAADTDVALGARLQQSIESLFSDRAATRGAAYDILTKQFRRDPEVMRFSATRVNTEQRNGFITPWSRSKTSVEPSAAPQG
jgi:hypothetical protein